MLRSTLSFIKISSCIPVCRYEGIYTYFVRGFLRSHTLYLNAIMVCAVNISKANLSFRKSPTRHKILRTVISIDHKKYALINCCKMLRQKYMKRAMFYYCRYTTRTWKDQVGSKTMGCCLRWWVGNFKPKIKINVKPLKSFRNVTALSAASNSNTGWYWLY